MTRLLAVLLNVTLTTTLALPVMAETAGEPTGQLVQKINTYVVRVHVMLQSGAYGVGSGVVVAQDQVVTNCHVIADAGSISVTVNGEAYPVSAIKPDWHHDVCILKTEGLDAPIAVMGASKALQYGQAVFATGHPSFQTHPSTTYGIVKGLYAMDDSVIVRASSSFMPGDSGGGLFDNTGKLVGVIALKSPGRNAYYYNLAVEWVQALLNQPEQSIHTKSSLPFWAESLENWPHFMRVVQPFLTEDWPALHQVAQEWTLKEPASSEAWFYLAAAEYGLRHIDTAEALLTKVVAMNSQHSQALYYLGLIEEDHGKRMEALNRVALLSVLDESIANKLKLAMGMQLEAPQ